MMTSTFSNSVELLKKTKYNSSILSKEKGPALRFQDIQKVKQLPHAFQKHPLPSTMMLALFHRNQTGGKVLIELQITHLHLAHIVHRIT